MDKDKAAEAYEKYLHNFPKVREWLEKVRKKMRRDLIFPSHSTTISPLDSEPRGLDSESGRLLRESLRESMKRYHAYNYGGDCSMWSPHPISDYPKKRRSNKMEIGFISLEKDFDLEPTKFMRKLKVDHRVFGTLFETSEDANIHQDSIEGKNQGGIIVAKVDHFMNSYRKRMTSHHVILRGGPIAIGKACPNEGVINSGCVCDTCAEYQEKEEEKEEE